MNVARSNQHTNKVIYQTQKSAPTLRPKQTHSRTARLNSLHKSDTQGRTYKTPLVMSTSLNGKPPSLKMMPPCPRATKLSLFLEAIGESEVILFQMKGYVEERRRLEDIALEWSKIVSDQRISQESSEEFCHLSEYHDKLAASINSDCALLEVEAISILASVTMERKRTVFRQNESLVVDMKRTEELTKRISDDIELTRGLHSKSSPKTRHVPIRRKGVITNKRRATFRQAVTNKKVQKQLAMVPASAAESTKTTDMVAFLSVMSRVVGRLKQKSRPRTWQPSSRNGIARGRYGFKPRGPPPKQTTSCVWDWRRVAKDTAK